MYVFYCCYRAGPHENLSAFLIFIETLFDYVDYNKYSLVIFEDFK